MNGATPGSPATPACSPVWSGSPARPTAAPRWHRVGIALAALLLLLTWCVSHRYGGLYHDALLYTLQAAARIHPDSLPRDVFLAFGSQDNFTIFSPLYAATTRLIGVENAAMTLTLLFQAALLATAWLLARSVLSVRAALLGLMVFIAIPGGYGPGSVFYVIEHFVTPRMAAEALVLAGLAAALHGRRVWAGVLLAAAITLHPLMAGAGAAALLCLRRRPWWLLAAVLTFTAAAAAFGKLQAFDPQWLALVKNRSPYLFIEYWTWDDATRCAVAMATLGFGGAFLPDDRARALCWAALTTALVGLGLTAVMCDAAGAVLFTQLQPWRWTWLATATSALVMPAVLADRWNRGVPGVIAALCLAAAWLFGSGAYCIAALAAAGASLLAARLQPAHVRLLAYGATGLVGIAVIYRIATNLTFSEAYYLEPTLPLWLRRLSSFLHDGSVPVASTALVLLLSSGRWRLAPYWALPIIALGAVVALCILARPTRDAWTMRDYPIDKVARFAPWRRIIPADADVFWPEAPAAAWLLLERANYLSVAQTSGMVFSRIGALEMQRRAQTLNPPLAPRVFLDWAASNSDMTLSRQQEQLLCATHAFRFLVTAADLQVPALAQLRRTPADALHVTRLYDCGAGRAETER